MGEACLSRLPTGPRMESHRSLLELGLLCQAALGSDLSASQEDEDLGDLSREAAALRARLRAVLR